MIEPLSYVPLLRWRQGEYLALEHLEEPQKNLITPLIEVLNPDYDFEERRPKKDIDEHLEKFGDRLAKKWGSRPFLLDGCHINVGTRMKDGRHPLRYMFDEAHHRHVPAVPVTAFDRDPAYQATTREIVGAGSDGLAIRCRLDEALDPDFDDMIKRLLPMLRAEIWQVDIILDLGTPSFEPLDGLVATVEAALGGSETMKESRSVTVLATSFPESMAEVKGPVQRWTRREWLMFKALVTQLPEGVRRPAFGDFGISSVRFPHGDMRKYRPAANVRYTTHDAWLIGKGKSIRDHGRAQFREICKAIMKSEGYLSAGFSPGNQYLADCGNGGPTGGSSTWKWVGTNHHITKIVHDLAILHES
jgi:hypothetical protein